jgi:predicted nucleotidyltransferase
MMSKQDSRLVDAFIDKVRTIPNIKGAVLFGSMARGDQDRRSDIDILLVIDDPKPRRYLSQVVHMISELHPHREIQVSLTNLKDRDESFLRTVFNEGRILFGSFLLNAEGIALKRYLLVSYDLSKIDPVMQVRVSRKVHGYTSRKRVDGKIKEYRYKGLKGMEGVRVISQGTVLLPIEMGLEFIKELDSMKVKRTTIEVYL